MHKQCNVRGDCRGMPVFISIYQRAYSLLFQRIRAEKFRKRSFFFAGFVKVPFKCPYAARGANRMGERGQSVFASPAEPCFLCWHAWSFFSAGKTEAGEED